MLLYHRVAELSVDPQRLAVPPSLFAEQLAVIRQHGVPMTLDALVRGAEEGTLPAGAVAVTFDDGYADNLEAAVPLLARHGVPATVFAAPGAADADREFWWDELEKVLLLPGSLPPQFSVRIGTERRPIVLGRAAEYSRRDYEGHLRWTVDLKEAPTARHHAYRDLSARLRTLTAADRARALADLFAVSGASTIARGTHRPLSPAGIASLARQENIAVGSHTVSHPALGFLHQAEQRREIAGGRARLESLTGRPVTAFAYPFGGTSDISPAVLRIARDAGMTLACTTRPGCVHAGSDRHALPRVIVRNWPLPEFRRHWQTWMGA